MSVVDHVVRLQELAALEPGWLDGAGAALSPGVVGQGRALVELIGELAPNLRYGIFPTPEGGLSFEAHDFYEERWSLSVEVASDLSLSVDVVGGVDAS